MMIAAGMTVKGTAFDAPLVVVTTTFPLASPEGRRQVICVADQDVGVQAVPLNVMVEPP